MLREFLELVASQGQPIAQSKDRQPGGRARNLTDAEIVVVTDGNVIGVQDRESFQFTRGQETDRVGFELLIHDG